MNNKLCVIASKFNKDNGQISKDDLQKELQKIDFSESKIQKSDELQYFKCLHYIKYWLSQADDESLTLQFFALRTKLIYSNMGLIYDCLKKTNIKYDPDSMYSMAQLTLIKAVDAFDPWRGYKFSSYCCTAIFKSFIKLLYKHRINESSEFEKEFLEWDQSVNDQIMTITDIINLGLAGLSQSEEEILSYRFGVALKHYNPSKRYTLREISEFKQLSIERIRQLEEQALSKIRLHLSLGK